MSKTWFITGASSGFGRELAELLLQRGDWIAATVRKPDALNDLAAQYRERLWVAILDVTDSHHAPTFPAPDDDYPRSRADIPFPPGEAG